MELFIREVTKKDIYALLNEDALWNNSFWVATRHRLLAHAKNSRATDNDVVLIISYLNDEVVGYMGAYPDLIYLQNKPEKITWLTTWWLHPKAVGKGVGREMLTRMYNIYDGRIGGSQFTPVAKRVYDKSGYFNYLHKLKGCKVDLRLNLADLLPQVNPTLEKFRGGFRLMDNFLNIFLDARLKLMDEKYKRDLKNYTVDYLTYLDSATEAFILEKQQNNLVRRDGDFFERLKVYQWVEEAPLVDLVAARSKYYFSAYNRRFNIYLVRLQHTDGKMAGFITLLRKDQELKVLQLYYEKAAAVAVAKLIIMHGIRLKTCTIITYDPLITEYFKKLSNYKIRFKRKERESIISKVYGDMGFEKLNYQYGDGDCSFA